MQDLSLHSQNIIICSLHCFLFITLYHQIWEVTICHKIPMRSHTHDSCKPSTVLTFPDRHVVNGQHYGFGFDDAPCCWGLLISTWYNVMVQDGATATKVQWYTRVLCIILYQNAEHLGTAGLFWLSTYNKYGTRGSRYYLGLESSLQGGTIFKVGWTS